MTSSLTTYPGVLTPLTSASRRAGADTVAQKLAAIRSWLADELVELEHAVQPASSDGDLAERAGAYLLGRPGKRVRPLCVVLGARLGGREMDEDIKAAAVAAELVHNATLLHDDVIDLGTERRGAPSARMVYGNAASVLGGDYLLTRALQLVEPLGGGLLRRLLATISDMVRAEAIQLDQRGSLRPDRDTYIEIIAGKTAALFQWAIAAGASLGGLTPEGVAAAERTGAALGLAFQLTDDLLDVQGDPNLTGKALFTDLAEGKLTWPFILAAERDPAVLPLVRAFLNGELEPKRVLERVIDTGAYEDTRIFAAEQGRIARSALEELPESAARDALTVVVDAAVSRSK